MCYILHMTSSKRPTAPQLRTLRELVAGQPLSLRSTSSPLIGLEKLGLITLPVHVFGQPSTGELAVTDAGRAYLASLDS